MSTTPRRRGIALARNTSGARQALRVGSSRAAPVRFRLYPESPRGLYVLVTVHPTKQAMRAHARRNREDKETQSGRTAAYIACWKTIVFRPGKPTRTKPIFAEVNFHRGRLGMEVVTHELFHATIQWGRRIGFHFGRLDADDSINDDEERLTYAHGSLCRAFMHRATAFGLYP